MILIVGRGVVKIMLNYGFEKFGRAVHDLAASSASIKERLRDATYHLGVLREENVPEEMRDEFNDLYARITSGIPQHGEGTLIATVNQITDNESVAIAGDIVSFNADLIGAVGIGERLRPVRKFRSLQRTFSNATPNKSLDASGVSMIAVMGVMREIAPPGQL